MINTKLSLFCVFVWNFIEIAIQGPVPFDPGQ
jgi:hypothetical protein